MRGIHRENIEEWLFEYHEGLLDATQKKDLLHFLVEYPEYNDDFVLWGSARLGVEEIRIPEEFSEQLKRKNPTSRWHSDIFWSFGVSIGLSLLSLYLFQPDFSVQIPKVTIPQVPSTLDTMTIKKQEGEVKAVKRVFIGIQPRRQDLVDTKADTQILPVESQDFSEEDMALPVIVQPLTIDSQIHIVHKSGLDAPLKLSSHDSVKARSLKSKLDKDKKKAKPRPSLFMKPAEEFQTDHPNF